MAKRRKKRTNQKELPILLHDYYELEIKELINPTGLIHSPSLTKSIYNLFSDSKFRSNRSIEMIEHKMNEHNQLRAWRKELLKVYGSNHLQKTLQALDFLEKRYSFTSWQKNFYRSLSKNHHSPGIWVPFAVTIYQKFFWEGVFKKFEKGVYNFISTSAYEHFFNGKKNPSPHDFCRKETWHEYNIYSVRKSDIRRLLKSLEVFHSDKEKE